jgi:hypothetical protein
LPGLVSIPCGWLGGFASDSLYRRGWSLTAARKTCLVGGMLTSSVITLSVFAPNAYMALFFFAIAYGSWPSPPPASGRCLRMWRLAGHVASIGGIQNFAANIAGIITATFTGVMLTITSGSFVVPLITAGPFA